MPVIKNQFKPGDVVRQTSHTAGDRDNVYHYYVVISVNQKGNYRLWSMREGNELLKAYPLENTVFYSFHKVNGEKDCL